MWYGVVWCDVMWYGVVWCDVMWHGMAWHGILYDLCLVFYLIYDTVIVWYILSLQSISRDVVDNVSHPRRLDPTMELITYSFVFYLQHGRHDVKCKPSIVWYRYGMVC